MRGPVGLEAGPACLLSAQRLRAQENRSHHLRVGIDFLSLKASHHHHFLLLSPTVSAYEDLHVLHEHWRERPLRKDDEHNSRSFSLE